MIEIGIDYNAEALKSVEGYIYCAFRYKDTLFVSKATEHCVEKIDLQSTECEKIIQENWFPRWIEPFSETEFVYVDSKRKTFGFIAGNEKTNEYIIPMKKPRFICKTYRNTFLIAGSGENPLIEVDAQCKVIATYLDNSFDLQSAYYVDENSVLLCDANLHQVLLCTLKGEILWEYGKKNAPGDSLLELSTPKYARCIGNEVYIADGKNNRVICVNWDKEIKFIYEKDDEGNNLWWPTCVDIQNKKLLITDAGNGRLLEYNTTTEETHQWGIPKVKKFNLNNPRCIEIINNSIYVADTYNNRIVQITPQMSIESFAGGRRGSNKDEMFWPRAIRSICGNIFYICDSRNSRIIKMDSQRNIHQIIYGYSIDNCFYSFEDPHDIDIFDDKILVTDSILNKVIEMNTTGTGLFEFGLYGELENPHHARYTNDGNILISDTGHNRILKIDSQGNIIYKISKAGSTLLREPRWCEEYGNNICITDSGNNRIILTDKLGEQIIKEFGYYSDSILQSVRVPRCTRIYKDYLVISDTYNNRIVIEDIRN